MTSSNLSIPSKDRVIVALDLRNPLEQIKLVETLGDDISFYKIGLGSLTTGGMALAMELIDAGKRIFLDMKLFDIGATVENAVQGFSQFGLDFLTVHGDPQVVRAAVKGRGESSLKILAVTILTSLDRADLDACLYKGGSVEELVVERARNAFLAGADGVIASAAEAKLIRELKEAEGKLIVTPGIRPEGAEVFDQKRVVTPKLALENGADYLVIGRPIWAASDPRAVVADILKTI